MPTLTTTTSTVGRMTNALSIIEQMRLPDSAGVSITHTSGLPPIVYVHPATREDLRRAVHAEVFAGVAWEVSERVRATRVRGVDVCLFDAREPLADAMGQGVVA